MAQARRTKKAKTNPKRGSGRSNAGPIFTAFRRGFGVFASGALVGVLATLFWQGYHSEDTGDLGSGLKDMIAQSRIQAQRRAEEVVPPEVVLIDKAPRVKAQYDFYTVLPEIEEVMPSGAEAPPPVTAVKVSKNSKAENKVKAAEQKPQLVSPGTTFMLQVASYGAQADAERLKAKLALGGLRASVQHVTIDRKNYYRVRIGPYVDYGSMTSDDYKLSQMGFKAMRLRLSKAG
jgi:cell division protein FtsN